MTNQRSKDVQAEDFIVPEAWVRCPMCSSRVKRKNLEQHVKTRHYPNGRRS